MSFFPVEYSTLSSQALLGLIKDNYSVPAGTSITFVKRGFNDTYLTRGAESKFLLRVYKHNWRSMESIETELCLLEYLKDNGISVSYPIPDKQGNFIHSLNAPEGIRYAVLFSFAEGIQVRKLSTEQAYLLGIETGKIHTLTQNKSFGIPAHDYAIETQFEITIAALKSVLKDYPEHYAFLLQLANEFTALFNSIDKETLPTGTCHGDLQAENFHITSDKQFTFFDFDFFGTGYLAYDIGVFRWYDHKNKTPEIMSFFLKGYQTQRALSSAETKLIPYFSMLRALFQMTLYCKISDGQQLPLWPAQQVADFIGKVRKWHSEYRLEEM